MSDNYYPCDCENPQCSGIVCQCKNCEYHSTDDHCHASNVRIGPSDAENSHETICGTFRAK